MTQHNRRKGLWYFNLAFAPTHSQYGIGVENSKPCSQFEYRFGMEKSGSNSKGNVFVHFGPRSPQRTGLLVLPFVSLNSELSQNGKVAKWRAILENILKTNKPLPSEARNYSWNKH